MMKKLKIRMSRKRMERRTAKRWRVGAGAGADVSGAAGVCCAGPPRGPPSTSTATIAARPNQ